MIEAVHQRYGSYNFSELISFRIAELHAQFADLQVKEQQWPLPGPDVTPMYKKYLTRTYKLGQNIVCAYYGCISHDITEFEIVLDSYGPLRRHLRIPEYVDISFDFSCGIDILDRNHIFMDKLEFTQDNTPFNNPKLDSSTTSSLTSAPLICEQQNPSNLDKTTNPLSLFII